MGLANRFPRAVRTGAIAADAGGTSRRSLALRRRRFRRLRPAPLNHRCRSPVHHSRRLEGQKGTPSFWRKAANIGCPLLLGVPFWGGGASKTVRSQAEPGYEWWARRNWWRIGPGKPTIWQNVANCWVSPFCCRRLLWFRQEFLAILRQHLPPGDPIVFPLGIPQVNAIGNPFHAQHMGDFPGFTGVLVFALPRRQQH